MQSIIPGKYVIILAALLTTAQLGASVNKCGDSTFINQSSGGSPTVADCQQITRNIADGGTWTIGLSDKHTTLVTFGTCAFGATPKDEGTLVGNEDIIDLINSSIQKFSYFGLVGSKGSMECSKEITVEWGIFHT